MATIETDIDINALNESGMSYAEETVQVNLVN